MKKRGEKPAVSTSPDHGPVTHYTIGKGISRMGMVEVNPQHPDYTAADLIAVLPKGTYTFEGRIAFAEKWATKILQDAGLPADPKAAVIYEMDGVKWRGTALSSLKAEARVSERWYAAEIMSELHLVRTLIERGETSDAAHRALDLGMLLRELFDVMLHNKKVLKWEDWQGSGSEGGSADKKIRPVVDWLTKTVKQYPEEPYTVFWNSIPDHDEGDRPERINGAKIIREGGVLVVKYDDGRKRFLAKSSFKRYVGDVKESLKK
jgi:hypothetical protein